MKYENVFQMLCILKNRTSLFTSCKSINSPLQRICIGFWFMSESIVLLIIFTYYYLIVLNAINPSYWHRFFYIAYTTLIEISCFSMGFLMCFIGLGKGLSLNRILCYGMSIFSSFSSILIASILLSFMCNNTNSIIIACLYLYVLLNFPITLFVNRKYGIFQNAIERFCAIWFIGQTVSIIFIILNLNFNEIYDYWSIIPLVVITINCIYVVSELPQINKLSTDIIMIYSSITFLIGIIMGFANMWNIFIVSVQNLCAALILYYYNPK